MTDKRKRGRTTMTDEAGNLDSMIAALEVEIERLLEKIAILEAELRVAYRLPAAIDRAFGEEKS